MCTREPMQLYIVHAMRQLQGMANGEARGKGALCRNRQGHVTAAERFFKAMGICNHRLCCYFLCHYHPYLLSECVCVVGGWEGGVLDVYASASLPWSTPLLSLSLISLLPPPPPPPLCVCVCISIFVYVSLCPHVFVYASVCFFVCNCLYPSLSLSCPCVYLSVCVCLNMSVSVSVCTPLYICVSVCLSLSLSLSLSISMGQIGEKASLYLQLCPHVWKYHHHQLCLSSVSLFSLFLSSLCISCILAPLRSHWWSSCYTPETKIGGILDVRADRFLTEPKLQSL